MGGARHAIGGIASAVILASCAFSAAVNESGIRAQTDARGKAVQSLLETVLALKVNDARTVNDFLQSTDLPKVDAWTLLQGAVAYEPPLFYGDGTCEVRVGLSAEALRANLKRIKEQHYGKKEGEFATVTFDSLDAQALEGRGVSMAPSPGSGARTVAECVPGWENASARKRIATEHSAHQEALGKLRAEVEKTQITEKMTLADLTAANPLAKEAVEQFLRKALPESKTYFPKGVVEVRFSMDLGALWAALESANPTSETAGQKVDASLLAAAKERSKGQALTAVGHSQVDGRAVSPSDAMQSAAPLDPGAIRDAGLGQEK